MMFIFTDMEANTTFIEILIQVRKLHYRDT